jgi:hypothetical protein
LVFSTAFGFAPGGGGERGEVSRVADADTDAGGTGATAMCCIGLVGVTISTLSFNWLPR